MPERHDVNETVEDRHAREHRLEELAEDKALEVSKKMRSKWRMDLVMVMVLFMVIIVGAVYKVQTDSVNNQRSSCERGNQRGVATLHLYHDLANANTARIKGAKSAQQRYSEPIGEVLMAAGLNPAIADVLLGTTAANVYARHQYVLDKLAYIDSQATFAEAPGADRPAGVRVRCDDALPYPWPL